MTMADNVVGLKTGFVLHRPPSSRVCT